MLYDLNIPWAGTPASIEDLQRTLSFLSELNYSVIALNHTIHDKKIPAQIVNAIPETLPFNLPKNITLLRRCTVVISDPAQNARLSALAAAYDILALRPTTEKAFLAACTNFTDQSLISLDLTVRYPFHFRPKPFMTAIKRGIRFEICYAQATATSNGSAERRNFISNVLAIARATSGRGLVISSEAASVLGVRAPADVANLLGVWGVSNERAKEAATVNPRSVVVNEKIKRTGYRNVIDVLDGGTREGDSVQKEASDKAENKNMASKKGKRKINEATKSAGDAAPLSKRQMKKMRLEEKRQADTDTSAITTNESSNTPETGAEIDTPKSLGDANSEVMGE